MLNIESDLIVYRLKSKTRDGAIVELLERLYRNGYIRNVAEARQAVIKREHLGTTGIGKGIAFPHAKGKFVYKLGCALGISSFGLDFHAIDKKPVHVIFLLVSPHSSYREYINMLSGFAEFLKHITYFDLLKCKSKKELSHVIQ